jgi:membrane dipeptidase
MSVIKEAIELRQNKLCVDLMKMKEAGSMAQFFASFLHMKRFDGNFTKAYEAALAMLEMTKSEFLKNQDMIALARNYRELMDNHNKGLMSGFLTVEEGGIIEGEMERLERLYTEGVRLITLTWNFENCFGYPNSDDSVVMNQGLKPFGIEAVERMNELGIIVDVSHLSDGGFWDVMKYSKKPAIASHSNTRRECGHRRNLTDEMIRALAEKGGISGINFYPAFLSEENKATVDDLVRHIVHMYHMGGEEFVAIGTDFDGFEGAVDGLEHMGKMPEFYEALRKRKFTDSQIEKFCYKNALRVIKEVC